MGSDSKVNLMSRITLQQALAMDNDKIVPSRSKDADDGDTVRLVDCDLGRMRKLECTVQGVVTVSITLHTSDLGRTADCG